VTFKSECINRSELCFPVSKHSSSAALLLFLLNRFVSLRVERSEVVNFVFLLFQSKWFIEQINASRSTFLEVMSFVTNLFFRRNLTKNFDAEDSDN